MQKHFDIARFYPPAAVAANIEGTVKGYYVIGKDGSVRAEDVFITSSEPPQVFDAAILSGLPTMKFLPACIAGKPSTEERDFVIEFRLDDDVPEEGVPPASN